MAEGRGKIWNAVVAGSIVVGILGVGITVGLVLGEHNSDGAASSSNASGTAASPLTDPVVTSVAAPSSTVAATTATVAPESATTGQAAIEATAQATTTVAVPPAPQVDFLVDLPLVSEEWGNFKDEIVDVNGTTYDHSILWRFSCAGPETTVRVEYNLGRKYSEFDAVLGVSDDSDSSITARFRILADNSELGAYDVGVGSPAAVALPIPGILHVAVEATYTMKGDCDLTKTLVLGTPTVTSA